MWRVAKKKKLCTLAWLSNFQSAVITMMDVGREIMSPFTLFLCSPWVETMKLFSLIILHIHP